MLVDNQGNWIKGIRQAQANANASGVPWVVWVYTSGLHTNIYCERATERDMTGESGRVRDGGSIVEPEKD